MQEKWLPGNTMDRIRDLCKRRNITQVELAQAMGMDRSTLSRVMSEKTSKLSSHAPNRTLSGGGSRLRRCCAEPDVQFHE